MATTQSISPLHFPQHDHLHSRSRAPHWIEEIDIAITPGMTFADAAQNWIERKTLSSPNKKWAGYIRQNTERGYRSDVRSLSLFFSDTRLCDIRVDHLVRYQRRRIEGAEPFIRYRRPHDAKETIVNGTRIAAKGMTPCPAKPKQVNKELNLLIRILKSARIWKEEQSKIYEPLIEEITEIPRALSYEQQQRWLTAARSTARWNIIHWYSLVAFDTCMSTNEIRALRLGDINLQQGIVTVPIEGAKNCHRHRSIPIASPEATWAMEQLIGRAKELGSTNPQHYLFPFRDTRKNSYVPDRPMTVSGIKTKWEEVRDASGLNWFRMYDTRHTAITRLAEGGIPFIMIMKRAGHVSPKMTDHYTHISDQRQARSVRMAQQYSGGWEPQSGLAWDNLSRSCTPRHSVSLPEHSPAQPQQQWCPPTPQPYEAAQAVTAEPNIMHPAIQAEIARQVALALQKQFAVVPVEGGRL